MTTPPLRPQHFPVIEGEVVRTDRDVPLDDRRRRASTAAMAARMAGREPDAPSLIASADGAIARMLMTIPSYAVREPAGADSNPYAAAYRDMLGKLPAGIELLVLTHEGVAQEVAAWLDAAGRADRACLVAADDFLGFSVWAEDAYVVIAEDGKRSAFVEPAAFGRYGDALVADRVSDAGDLGLFQAPLHLQGGNVLIGDEFFLIGLDYPILTFEEGILEAPPGQELDVLLAVYRRYLDAKREFVPVASQLPVPSAQQRQFELDGGTWVESIYAGNAPGTRQPLFHVDMFISLAGRARNGRYRLVVGDPREAARILDAPLQPHAMAEIFDDIARQLEARGFEVHRNPLPLVYADDEQRRLRRWYFATSNNALVHRPEGGRPTVLLPTYGHGAFEELVATDARNREVWEGLGYDVVQLGDFHAFAVNLGAVHCVKKYLGRA